MIDIDVKDNKSMNVKDNKLININSGTIINGNDNEQKDINDYRLIDTNNEIKISFSIQDNNFRFHRLSKEVKFIQLKFITETA